MDSRSLQTASSYINNLLLSRGLLRNGVPIEFAAPEKAEGGLDATMAKVMNLVHDMILRRDRESDTLSTISHNLQSMRTSSGHQSQIITRLENYNADLNRQIALISAQEKVAKETLRTADARTKALKEEMSRLKSTVAQIRSQCANDIRRRDGEIKKLKKHLVGRRGREGTGSPVGVVVVTTAVNKIQSTTRQVQNEVDLKSPEYSLTQETTEFLTQLSQGLSDENDALISLVRNTLETLRNLQGLPVGPERGETTGTCDLAIAAPPSYEELAITMDEVLEHLRGLLTNPAFVPLEEVEVREDEIIRLRQGWEKMEARWQEAVSLMDGWRQRMVSTGDTINLDDLQLGMELASSKDPAALPSHESLIPKQENIDIANSSDLDRAQDASNDPSEVNLIEDLSIDELDTPITTAPSPTKMSPRILSPRSPNVQPPSIRKPSFPSPCNAFFSPIPEEDISPLKSPDEISIPWFSPVKKPSCFPKKPNRVSPSPSPPRTIAQKLATAQAEAEEAKKRAAREARTLPEEIEKRDAAGDKQNDAKSNIKSAEKRIERKLRSSRRRSTLSPEELERLMGCL